jgi:hypothetical protein
MLVTALDAFHEVTKCFAVVEHVQLIEDESVGVEPALLCAFLGKKPSLVAGAASDFRINLGLVRRLASKRWTGYFEHIVSYFLRPERLHISFDSSALQYRNGLQGGREVVHGVGMSG